MVKGLSPRISILGAGDKEMKKRTFFKYISVEHFAN